MSSYVIDIHPHVISTDLKRYPLNPLGGKRSTWSKQRPVGAEELLAAMDRAEVRKAAVVQSSTTYGHDNSYLADSVEQHRDRFAGVCSVDVLSPTAVADLDYWINERHLAGLRLFTTGSTMPAQAEWLADPRTFPAWEWAGEAGVSICVQMNMDGLPLLRRMLEKFPRVSVILDHLARAPIEEGPPYAGSQGLFDLSDYENVHLKVTTNSILQARKGEATPETIFPELVRRFGANRIAWGSNYPAAEGSLEELVQVAKTTLGSCLEAADLDWIFRRTALCLYPTLEDGTEGSP